MNLGFLDGLARTIAGMQQQPGNHPGYLHLWEQLKPWLGNITANATRKWLPQAGQGSCEVPYFEEGRPVGPCEYASIDRCCVCKRHVCLSHAFVDSNCDSVCYLCVGGLSERRHAAPPAPKVDPAVQLAWAHGTLGVEPTASWDEITASYKRLLVLYHPDKPTGNEALYKKVRTAYDLLQKVHGK